MERSFPRDASADPEPSKCLTTAWNEYNQRLRRIFRRNTYHVLKLGKQMKFSKAASGEQEETGEESGSRFMGRKFIVSALLIIVLLVSAYYVVSAYEDSVVQTTVVTGTITTIQLPSSSPGAAPAAGNLGGPAPLPVPAVGGSSALTYVVISVGSTSITQILPCSSVQYKAGQTVKVADQQLRDGQQRYFPDVACRGQVSPFQSVNVSQTTNSSSSSH